MLKNSQKQALVYFCNALDSSPLGSAKVTLWEGWNENDGTMHTHSESKETDTNGIAVFDLVRPTNNSRIEVFAAAASDDRQAF